MKSKFFNANMIAKISIFSALSFVLYMFPKFTLPFFPSFLEINFSDIPALIGGFLLGPFAGAVIVAVKVLIKLPFSSSAGVGELADFLIGVSFAVVPAIIYRKHKTIKFALIGIIIGAIASIVMAVISNIYILIPFYVRVFFNGDMNLLVNLCKAVIKDITVENFYTKYTLYAVIPFNILRCTIAGSLTFLLYKRISKLFHKF